MLNFISEHVTFFSSIIGTLVGGLLTFLTTITLEKEREKRVAHKDKLENILIPYCTSVEAAEKAAQQIDKKNFDRNFDEFTENLHRPLDYLEAGKRLYLSKDECKQLEHYMATYNEFGKVWNSCFGWLTE